MKGEGHKIDGLDALDGLVGLERQTCIVTYEDDMMSSNVEDTFAVRV